MFGPPLFVPERGHIALIVERLDRAPSLSPRWPR
jgi:hypothetical protein